MDTSTNQTNPSASDIAAKNTNGLAPDLGQDPATQTQDAHGGAAETEQQDLNALILELQRNQAEMEGKQFVESTLARFSDIIRYQSEDTLYTWADRILDELCPVVNGLQASLYTTKQDETQRGAVRKLQLVGAYAFDLDQLEAEIPFGRGLIGQAAKSGKSYHFSADEEFETRAHTSTAELKPSAVLIHPLLFNDTMQGVLEISSLHEFDERNLELIKSLCESLAANLMTIQNQEAMRKLLEEAQEKSEQMAAQEEELRQNMEELQANQDHLKLAQEEISAQKQMVERLVQEAPFGICVTNLEGLFVQVNKSYCDIYGYTEEELLNQPFTVVVPPEQRDAWQQVHHEYMEGKREVTGEFEVRGKDGRKIHILTDSIRVTNPEGELEKITYVTDITELYKLKESTEAKNQLVEKLVNDAPVGICITDEHGVFVNANESYAQMYGYTTVEIIGQPFTLVVPPEDKESWMQVHHDFMAGKCEVTGEFEVRGKGGRPMHIWTSSILVTDEKGEKQKITYVTDITELQQVKESAEANNKLIDQLVADAPVGICITDEHGKFIRVNHSYAKMYGYEPQEMLDQPFTMVVPPEQKKSWMQVHRDFMAGKCEVTGEFEVRGKGGRPMHIWTSSIRVTDNRGEKQKITYVTEITELKQVKEAAEANNKLIDQLVADAPVGICITDEHGKFVRINDSYAQMYGYDPQEMLGQPFTLVTPPEQKEEWMPVHHDFMNGKCDVTGEFEVRGKGGRPMHIWTSSIRVTDNKGVKQKITYVTDITELKQVKEAAEANSKLVEQLVADAPVGICITDEHGKFIRVNDSYARMYGYEPQEMVGQPFTLVTPPEQKEEWMQVHHDFIAGKCEVTGEFDVRGKGGRPMRIWTSSILVTDALGVKQKITYVVDITDSKAAFGQKQTQQELKQAGQGFAEVEQNPSQAPPSGKPAQVAELEAQLQLLETFALGCSTPALLLGPNRQIRFANYAMGQRLGFSPEQLKGQHYRMLHDSPNTTNLWDQIAEQARNQGRYQGNASLRNRSGGMQAWDVQITAVGAQPESTCYLVELR